MKLELTIEKLKMGNASAQGVIAKIDGTAEEVNEVLKNLGIVTNESLKENNIKMEDDSQAEELPGTITFKLDRDTKASPHLVEVTVEGCTYHVFTENQTNFIKVVSGEIKMDDAVKFVKSLKVMIVNNNKIVKSLGFLDTVIFVGTLCDPTAIRKYI